MVDDALHYLEIRGLVGKHRTVRNPPALNDNGRLTNGVRPVNSTNVCHNGEGSESFHGTYRPKLFVWSASDESGITRIASLYDQYFSSLSYLDEDEAYLDDLAYTLANRRSMLPWKTYLVAHSTEHLRSEISSGLSKAQRTGPAPRLAFVFTGQGAQWYAMGRELFQFSVFKSSLEAAETYLLGLGCDWLLTSKSLAFKIFTNLISHRRVTERRGVIKCQQSCVFTAIMYGRSDCACRAL